MTEPTKLPIGFVPRDYQIGVWEAFARGIRKFCLVWPRQIGKDTNCFAFMCREAHRVPGNYFYIFPTQKQAKDALWKKVMEDGSKLLNMIGLESSVQINGKPLVTRISNQEMTLELHNGSTISVLGLDTNPDAARGVTPMGVVFSEFAFSDFNAYKNMLPALRREGSWRIINSTPNGRNHFYDMYQAVKDKDDWYVSFYQCLWPNKPGYLPVLTQEYFTNMVNAGESTWEDVEREFGCSFAAGLKGSFYSDALELAREHGRIGRFAYDANIKVNTCWDLGVDDQTVCWFYQNVGNSRVFIDYKKWTKAEGASGYISFLGSKPYVYDQHLLPHDSANRRVGEHRVVSTADLFEEALRQQDVSGSVAIVSKPTNKQHAIDLVRTQFPLYYFNSETCREGIHHLELYHRRYDAAKKTFSVEPVHDEHSHTADAIQTGAIAEQDAAGRFYEVQDIQYMDDFDAFD